MLFAEHGHKEVIEAVEAAIIAGVISREAVEHLLRRESGGGHDYSPTPPSPDVSVYSQTGGAR